MSQAVTVKIPGLNAFYQRVARGVTTYVSGMRDVTLGDGTMEATHAIAIASWSDFAETVEHALRIWSYDVHDGSPLTFPVPENFLNLVKLNVDSKMRDQHGDIQIKVEGLDEPKSYDDENVAALFGDDGFFTRYYKMYSGVEYKKQDFLTLVNGKETVLDVEQKESTSYKQKNYNLDTIPICTGIGTFVSALDGFDQDVAGLASLCPIKVPVDIKQLTDRCMYTSMPNHGTIEIEEVAERATHWVMTTRNGKNYAVRSYMSIQMERALLTTHLQAIINGIAKTPSKDIVASLPSIDAGTLDIGQTSHGLPLNKVAITLGLAVSNPHALTIDTDVGWQAFHTIAEKARNTATPTVVTESIRSHKSRFITYTGNSIHAGFIQCILDSQELLHGTDPSGPTLSNLMSGIRDPDAHTTAMLVLYRQLTYMDTLTRACSSFLTLSSMISVDNNRLPISQKYIVKVWTDDQQDTTGLDITFLDQDTYLSGNDVLKYIVRLPLTTKKGTAGATENALILTYFSLSDTVLDFAHHQLNNFEAVRENIAGPSGFAGEIMSDPDFDGLTHGNPGHTPDIKTPAVELVAFINKNIGNQGRVLPGSLYYFTKLSGDKLRTLARDLKDSLHFPYVKDGTGHDRTSLTGAGYSRVERSYNSNHWTVADASRKNPTTGKPISNNGVILKYLSVKGGGGIFSFLGPIVGSLADSVGIPVLGDVARAAGSLIPI